MATSCFVDGASNMSGLSLLLSLLLLLSFPRHKGFFEIKTDRWEILIGYPIRVLVVTFLGLCLVGVFLGINELLDSNTSIYMNDKNWSK